MTRNDNSLLRSNRMGNPMKWRMTIVAVAATLGLGVVADGCATAGPNINQVQTNLVDKSMFEGEWWYATTIIDVAREERLDLALVVGEEGEVEVHPLLAEVVADALPDGHHLGVVGDGAKEDLVRCAHGRVSVPGSLSRLPEQRQTGDGAADELLEVVDGGSHHPAGAAEHQPVRATTWGSGRVAAADEGAGRGCGRRRLHPR